MPERILVIDDNETMRKSLQLALEAEGFIVATASDGFKAIEIAQKENFDLILCDVRMPGIDGLETLDKIKEFQPVARNIVITAYASQEAPIQALKMNVDDYLMKPFSSEDLIKSIRASFVRLRKSMQRESGSLRFRRNFLRLVSGVFFESRISYLVGHSEKIARLSAKLGESLGFSPQQQEKLYLAGLLHDIGYVELPLRLLEKKQFSPGDYELVKNHPSIARDLLHPFEELKEIATIIFHHHERWDGGGYPRGLKGEQIPLESRILAVAEAYDSLVSERPHRSRKGIQEALKVVKEERGVSFDPQVADALPAVLEMFDLEEETAQPFVPEKFESKTSLLLNLADIYRQLGNYEVAEKAYLHASEILSRSESPELEVRAELGRISIMAEQGHYHEALESAKRALSFAQDKFLQFMVAKIRIKIAFLKLKTEQHDGVEEALYSARETFSVWESHYDLCETDFFLSALNAAADGDGFTVTYSEFLKGLQNGKFYEIIGEYADFASALFKYSLDKEILSEETLKLFEEGEAISLKMLEKLASEVASPHREKLSALLLQFRKERGEAPPAAEAGTQEARKAPARPLREVTPETQIQVFFFGKFRVLAGSEPLDDNTWKTRKVKSLFAYLVSRRGEVLNEQKLMDLFWLQETEKARMSLYNCISMIRKIFTPYLGERAKTLITKKREGYLIQKNLTCIIDLEEFEEHFHRAKSLYEQNNWQEAIVEFQKADRLYTGEFMEDTYDEWSDDQRLKSKTKHLEILHTLGKYFFDKQKYDVSIDYWKKILSYDDCFEDAYLGLMLCYIATDNQAEAIRSYHKCVQTLKKELNIAPPPQILEIYFRLIEGEKVQMTM